MNRSARYVGIELQLCRVKPADRQQDLRRYVALLCPNHADVIEVLFDPYPRLADVSALSVAEFVFRIGVS
jgi:hypothetical protein